MAKGTNNDLQNTIQNQSGIDIAIDDILIKNISYINTNVNIPKLI